MKNSEVLMSSLQFKRCLRYVMKHRSERQTQKLMFVNIIALAKIQCSEIDINRHCTTGIQARDQGQTK